MKFSIRYADQIVGAFVILALAILIFVILMLGRSQRWFAKDYQYKAYFDSAQGLSPNMAVQYKGFTMGHVKTISLKEDDRVEVLFTIFDVNNDRVKEGSLVEVQVSPIGLGNQFLFHPGKGTVQIQEGEEIPAVNSQEAKRLAAAGLTNRPESSDSIGNIMNQVNSVLGTLDGTLTDVKEAIGGTDRMTLGRTLLNVEGLTEGLSQSLPRELDKVLDQINVLLKDLEGVTKKLSDPEETVAQVLDAEGPIYKDLVSALDSLAATLKGVEKLGEFIPTQLPQIAVLLSSVQLTLSSVQDVLAAVANNPLLKGGVPVRKESSPGGASPRDLEF
ncbi:MAG: MlaD family protein [Treponema sp.]|jgi:phospholipid/cholesterol/gamma-HCH transport system substrate-binding protein|nr:MlaD family protein [Treponema sp.]